MTSTIRHCVATAGLVLATGSYAAGHLAVSREITVDRAPDTVWKLVGEFNSLDVWLPPVLASTFTGSATQPGAVRVLDLGNNASVTEKLLSWNGTEHRYSYAFLSSPLPVKNYVAAIELTAAGEGKTKVKWSSTFDADGAPDDKAKEAILGIYDAGLGKLSAIFR
jgi:mxaD protein